MLEPEALFDQIAEPGTEARALLNRLDLEALPRHVAIIMDGNGRWARARKLPRTEGHRAGIRRTRETVELVAALGIEVTTLFAFSTENWKRPRAEVRTLMGLLEKHIGLELDRFARNNLRLRPIGRIEQLDRGVQKALRVAVDRTSACTGPLIQIALSYSGRQDLTDMVKAAAQAAGSRHLGPDEIDEQWVSDHLDTHGTPDPDLLIRTSGEHRLSNFLLWQIAYSEFYFTPKLWPDFDKTELLRALLEYQRRSRRFGGLPTP